MPTWDKEKADKYYQEHRTELRKQRREWYLKKKEVKREVVLNTGSRSMVDVRDGIS